MNGPELFQHEFGRDQLPLNRQLQIERLHWHRCVTGKRLCFGSQDAASTYALGWCKLFPFLCIESEFQESPNGIVYLCPRGHKAKTLVPRNLANVDVASKAPPPAPATPPQTVASVPPASGL